MRQIKDPALQSRKKAELVEFGVPICAGMIAGLATSSVWWGLVAGAVGVGGAFLICGHIWPIWMCGPRRDELQKALTTFTKKSFNNASIDMVVNGRSFKLFRKEDIDNGTYAFRLHLPWQHWQDIFQEGTLKRQLESESGELCEDEHGLFVETGDEPDRILQLIDYVLEAVEADLDSLECHSSIMIFDVRQPNTHNR